MSDVQKPDPREAILNAAREKLSRFVPRAIEILTELAETGENERVRLAAVEAVLDRSGLGKTSSAQVTVSQGEHEAARKEAEDVVARIQENQRAVAERAGGGIDLTTLIVVEGVLDEEPVGAASS